MMASQLLFLLGQAHTSGSPLLEEYKPNTWYQKYDCYVLLARNLLVIFLLWSCQFVIAPALLLVLLFMLASALLLALPRSRASVVFLGASLVFLASLVWNFWPDNYCLVTLLSYLDPLRPMQLSCLFLKALAVNYPVWKPLQRYHLLSLVPSGLQSGERQNQVRHFGCW
jgi:hypothetical protein